MRFNLTDGQKALLRWFVERAKDGFLREEFHVVWGMDGGQILGGAPGVSNHPDITKGALDVLAAEGFLVCKPNFKTTSHSTRTTSSMRPQTTHREVEINRRCTLTGLAFEAVDSDFAAPDVSFVTHLTPLADIMHLDEEIKTRCLPILGAGSADPRLWDSAVRTVGVILEERLRDVGTITDPSRIGRDLVNDVFGNNGKLAGKFPQDSERQGYRDLYAGVVGALRNPYAHRFIDPAPEDGGATIVFVNLLLKMLEDLR